MMTNNTVEVDAHAVSMEAISREWLRIPAWVLACSGMAVMTFIFRWGWKLSYSKGIVTNLQREVTASLRAAVLYQAMVIPLVYPDLLADLPTHLVDSYGSLPFWYAFVVTTSVGSWLKYAVSSMTGSSIAVLAVMFINTLIGFADGLLPPAWISLGVVVFCFVFAFTLYIANLTVCTKQYTMAIWSTVIVKYLANGSASRAAAEMAVFDGKTGIQWDGMVLCQVYLVLLANVCSFFALPFTPGWQCHGARRLFKAKVEASLEQDEEKGREEAGDPERAKVLQLFMAKEQVRQGLCDLAIDTTGAMEKLLSHFRRGTSANALQSSYLYIRKLGARRTVVENLMEDAEWECASFYQLQGHDRLGAVAGMLRGQRQILRILLENLKAVPDHPDESVSSEQTTKEIQPKLSCFLGKWRDVLVAIADPTFLRTGSSPECSKVPGLIREADEAVVEMLETLYAKESLDDERKHCEMAFLHCLRCSCALLKVFITELNLTQESPKAEEADSKPVIVFRSIQERLHELRSNLGIILLGKSPSYGDALRNTGSWMLALAWCILVRGGATSCLTSVSFVFSVTLGMLFQRNVNRMVGVAMGLVFGNMPALVLLQDEESGHAKFVYFPQGLLIYMALMFAMFFAAMYGYLATGSRYSYAYLLWAGFGGSFMLTHLKAAAPGGHVSDSERASNLFLSMMDNFVGCMLVFIVDIFCVKLFKGHASSRVAEILPTCLDDISAIITDFREATKKVGTASSYCDIANESEALRKAFLAVDIKRLQLHIASARYWDAEVLKEDPIWTMAGSEYKTDLIGELLNLCDDAYVAVYTMQLTARSIGCMAHVHSTARRVWQGLPHAMSQQARRCSQATKAALADSLFLETSDSAAIGLATAEASQVVVLERTMTSVSPPRWQNTSAIQEYAAREEASSAAISMSLLVATKLLATALASMEILLREHAFWATGDWQNGEMSGASFDERATLQSQVSARMLIWESDVQSFILEENDQEVDAYPSEPPPRASSDGSNGGPLRRREDPPPPDVRRGRYKGPEAAGTATEGNLSGASATSQGLGEPLLQGDSLRERP